MAKVKVPVIGTINKVVFLDPNATQGATIGTDLRLPNGTVPTLAQLAEALGVGQSVNGSLNGNQTTLWRLIREVPPNVLQVAALSTSGLVVRKADGTWATRSIAVQPRLTIANAAGDAGNPTLDLETISFDATGELLAVDVDIYGRITGMRAAVLDDLDDVTITSPADGSVLYYTGASGWVNELLTAVLVTYDNSSSGLAAVDVQAAIDELALSAGTGSVGPMGPPGMDGEQGEEGSSGPPGPAGVPGPTGSAGPSGGPGVPGSSGPPGMDGEQGEEGPPGPSGVNASALIQQRGATWTNGTSAIIAANVLAVPIVIAEDCTIKDVTVLTKGGNGSCVIDIWRIAYGSYPPTAANSITASSKPTISGGVKYRDATLSGWGTALSAGDTVMFNLDSSSTFTEIVILVTLRRIGSTAADGYTDARVRTVVTDMLDDGIVFYDAGTNTYTVTLIGSYNDLNVFELCGSPGSATTVNFTVPPGTVVKASGTTNPALEFSGFASGSTINWLNTGKVLGHGGNGGDGGSAGRNGSADYAWIGGVGGPGGSAVRGPGTGVTFNVTNSGGFIWGGGGGGGGGGNSSDDGANIANGGGGGGGAGWGLGGRGGKLVYQETTTCTAALDGIGGGIAGGGAGQTATSTGSAAGGTGGNGGTWGAAGSAGSSPTTYALDIAGGGGGAAGKAVDLNGGSISWVSGSGSPNVEGAVS